MIENIKNDLVFRRIIQSDFSKLNLFFDLNNVPQITNTFSAFQLNSENAMKICNHSGKDLYFLCLLKDEIVGFSMLRGWDEGFTVPSFGVFVDQKFQGKGIGKIMLDLTLSYAKNIKCKSVRLSVYSSNPVAYNLYLKFGFVEIGVEAITHNGFEDNKIIMIKELQ